MEKQLADLNQGIAGDEAANKRTLWDDASYYTTPKNAMKKSLKNVLYELEEVLNDAKPQTMVACLVSKSAIVRSGKEIGASVDESDVYGRREEKELSMSSDNSSETNYTVTPIVGMGEVGKTTLARIIFHDQRIKASFGMRSWACISDVFDCKWVVKELVEYATGESVSNMETPALRCCLEETVMGKNLLIVLDDIWEWKAWDMLKASFAHCAKGSKILVTIRDKKVGTSTSNKEPYELQTMKCNDCWDLFKKKVFGHGADGYLEKVGREIVKKNAREFR